MKTVLLIILSLISFPVLASPGSAGGAAAAALNASRNRERQETKQVEVQQTQPVNENTVPVQQPLPDFNEDNKTAVPVVKCLVVGFSFFAMGLIGGFGAYLLIARLK